MADNLVLLCRNHHEIADAGVLPTTMLRFYRDNPGTPVELPDEAILYGMRAEEVRRLLAARFDRETLASSLFLISRLQRAHDPRYRQAYFGLVDVTLQSMVSHHPRRYERTALALIKKASLVEAELDDREASYRAGRIAHHHGVLLNQLKQHDSAIDRYTEAKLHFERAGDESPRGSITDERALLQAHLSAALHLSGKSDEAREMAEEVVEARPFTQAGTYARIKVAEHCIVRNDFSGAAVELEDMIDGSEVDGKPKPSLVHQTIALKDWAVVQAHGGDRMGARQTAVAGLTLARALGFDDQAEKIVSRLAEVGVSDLGVADGRQQASGPRARTAPRPRPPRPRSRSA